jgi:hypothetical protein
MGLAWNNFRLARDSPKISGSATELPFSQWGGRFGCFSERPSFVRRAWLWTERRGLACADSVG